MGLDLKVKGGEKVSRGDCLVEIMSRNEEDAEAAKAQFLSSIEIAEGEIPKETLIYTLDD